MSIEFRKPSESKEKPLNEIAKEVNDFLDPIVEKTFKLKARKEYMEANENSYDEAMEKISEKAKDMGLEEDQVIKVMGDDMLEAESEFETTEKIIREISPEATLSFDLIKKIKEYDKKGKLEKEISNVYGLSERVTDWRMFLLTLSISLRENPFNWDDFREYSELK